MSLPTTIIFIQIAVVTAFLALWYLWVKGKLRSSFFLEDEHQVLFPFKYFTWTVLGVLVATSLAQVHFMRVSSTVHERLAEMTSVYEKQEQTTRALHELNGVLRKVRQEMDSNFSGLRAQIAQAQTTTASIQTVSDTAAQRDRSKEEQGVGGIAAGRNHIPRNAFAKEAKASSANGPQRHASASPATVQGETPETVPTMTMTRQARVLTDRLLVRQQPQKGAAVVERLMAGQQIKVTEKCLRNDSIWFRVVTPSGRSGWVDFRHVKLERNA